MAGVQVIQIVSAIYKEGPHIIDTMADTLKDWMFSHNYNSIEKFRWKAAQKNINKHMFCERSQFMRYFSDAKYKKICQSL